MSSPLYSEVRTYLTPYRASLRAHYLSVKVKVPTYCSDIKYLSALL